MIEKINALNILIATMGFKEVHLQIIDQNGNEHKLDYHQHESSNLDRPLKVIGPGLE